MLWNDLQGHGSRRNAAEQRRTRWITLAAALLAFDAAHTSAAGIDQLPYFNPLAGTHPERILCESDLDWGQDLNRLSVRLRQLGVRRVSIAYFGTARLEAAGLPEFSAITGKEPVPTGNSEQLEIMEFTRLAATLFRCLSCQLSSPFFGLPWIVSVRFSA